MNKDINSHTRTLYKRSSGSDDKNHDFISVTVEEVFGRPTKVTMESTACSDIIMEDTRDWDMESFIVVDEPDSLTKLMNKCSARDAEMLAARLEERFAGFGNMAYERFVAFLNKKGIQYTIINY